LFWALKDVSFEVRRGQVVGIIGRNGAGKSTLLKILSRVTEPTEGEVDINGQVGSLLEVGTGFHPELTGRENVYLNGAILGMRRAEIARKFDEIVAFAEVEKFIDTPVKHYSSGMYMRLAFAVAAHLEPEVLVVDEVLAVGDLQFQNKCLGRMSDISRQGRTVLFVSHNMAAIQALCTRVIALSEGSVVADGLPGPVIARYLTEQAAGVIAEYDLTSTPRAAGLVPLFRAVRIRNGRGELAAQVFCGDPLAFEFDLRLPLAFTQPQLGIGVDDVLGQRVFSVATYLSATPLSSAEGEVTVCCRIDELPLSPGRYTLSISAGNQQEILIDEVQNIVRFDVVEAGFYRNGRAPTSNLGRVLVRSNWNLGQACGPSQNSSKPVSTLTR
jgi:lipopolysaccharide transport system ATP-binding protein